MTIEQVQAATKAADMLLQVYDVSNRPGEQAIVVQDKTANFHSPSQVEMMNQRFAHIAGVSTSGSGLKMIVRLSSVTHAVMEIEVRDAGIDESESDAGGVLYGVGVKKWGLPTGQAGSLGSGAGTDAATWGVQLACTLVGTSSSMATRQFSMASRTRSDNITNWTLWPPKRTR